MSKAKFESPSKETPNRDPNSVLSEDPEWWIRHALEAVRAGRRGRARALAQVAQTLDPAVFGAIRVEAQVWFRLGEAEAAMTALNRLKMLAPDIILSWRLMAMIRNARLDSAGAIEYVRRCLMLRPDSISDIFNFQSVLRAHFLDAVSERWLRRAIMAAEARGPKHSDPAAFELGMRYLAEGRWAEGWPLYDRRLRLERSKPDPDRYPQPRWDGAPAPGRHLLVWGDQNIGDEMQFARILGEVRPLVGRVTLETDPRLVPLFARSMPWLTVIPRGEAPPEGSVAEGPFDLQLPSGHLGGLFRSTPEDFDRAPIGGSDLNGGSVAWLKADPDRTARLRARYRKASGGRPVIGIAWNSTNKFFRGKNVALPDWVDILGQKRAMFLSVQYGSVDADLTELRDRTGMRLARDAEIDPLTDLDGFAAQLAAMDLVISTSNSTVHQACGLGLPVWSLIHARPDWRWGLKGSRSPWFPTLRLYRQPTQDDWATPLSRLAADLALWLDDRTPPATPSSAAPSPAAPSSAAADHAT